MAKFSEKQLYYFTNREFEEKYKSILIHRLTDSNLELEKISIYDALKLYNNTEALNKMYTHYKRSKYKNLTEKFIIEIADTINRDSIYISNGYRKIGDSLEGDANIPIDKPYEIKKDMQKLLFDYYYTWKYKDVFEREALFNIEFLRIHPFEDGNGRTSRLLLTYNLVTQGYVPAIILPEVREEYFKARNNSDVEWIKNKFKELSDIESTVVDSIINNYSIIENSKKKIKTIK